MLLQWRNSPHQSLASSILRLQISLLFYFPTSVYFAQHRGSVLMLSSHRSSGLPTGLLPWKFPALFFRYSRMIHSDYMSGPLQCFELNIFYYVLVSLVRGSWALFSPAAETLRADNRAVLCCPVDGRMTFDG